MIRVRRCLERSFAFVLASAVFGATSAARADSNAEPIHVEYRADTACPSAEQFLARVLSRTTKARIASAGESARTFEIAIERRARGFAGSLAIHEADGQTMARTVTDASCPQVADVLALAMVLAIDPAAMGEFNGARWAPPQAGSGDSDRGSRSGSRDATRDGTTSDATTRDATTRDATTRDGESPRDSESAESDDDESSDGEASSAGADWRANMLLGPLLQSRVTPSLALGGSLAINAEPREPLIVSSLGVRFSALQSLPHSESGAQTTFQFVSLRPQICSAALRPVVTLALALCVSGDVGVVFGRGSELPSPRTERRFWFAAEVPLRAQLALGSSWLVQAEAGLLLPVTRYRFVFSDPETRIYDVPPVAFTSELLFGLRL